MWVLPTLISDWCWSCYLRVSSIANVFVVKLAAPTLCHLLLLWVTEMHLHPSRVWQNRLVSMQGALHSVFCTHMLLHIRKTSDSRDIVGTMTSEWRAQASQSNELSEVGINIRVFAMLLKRHLVMISLRKETQNTFDDRIKFTLWVRLSADR